MANDRCLIKREGECIMKDETAIVLAVSTTAAVLISIPLLSVLNLLSKR